MGMIVWKKLEKIAHRCFDGDLTMPKTNFWLIGAVCVLAGIVYGLCMAPLTHGVTIGSNNGNSRNCVWGEPGAAKKDEEEIKE